MDLELRLAPIWSVDSRRCFVRESIRHLGHLPNIRSLREILEPVRLAYPLLTSIYVRGSVLEETNQSRVRDVDVVCISLEKLPANLEDSVTRDMAGRLALSGKKQPLDLRFITLQELETRPVRSASTLGVIYRSLPLCAQSEVPFEFDVEASPELALALAATEMREIGFILKRYTTLRFESRRVEWLQKRALRLGGIAGLLTSASYSRHLPTCVRLGAAVAPEIYMPIVQVWDDFVERRLTRAAFGRARELVLGWADMLDKYARQSTTA